VVRVPLLGKVKYFLIIELWTTCVGAVYSCEHDYFILDLQFKRENISFSVIFFIDECKGEAFLNKYCNTSSIGDVAGEESFSTLFNFYLVF